MISFFSVDNTPPNITPVNDITIRLQPLGSRYHQVSWPEPTVTDNSGFVIQTYKSHTSGVYFTIGTTVVTYTFTDGSGNSATMSFNINILECK